MFLHFRGIFVAAASLVVAATLTATSASASPGSVTQSLAGGHRPVVVGDTGFQPARDFGADVHAACGTEVVGYRTSNTVNHRVIRRVTFSNGDVLVTAKGAESVTFSDANSPFDVVNGVDVTLPISGTSTKLILASGATITRRTGPSLVITSNYPDLLFTAEAGALQKAHVKDFSAFSRGALTEYTNATGSAVAVITKPAAARNICDLMGLGAYRDLPLFLDDSEFDSFGL